MLLHLLMAVAVLAPLQPADPLAPYRQAAEARWEADIQALEKLDREQTDPAQAVLFLGSSSIRRWDSIAADMAPYAVIQRGYGGAKFSDLAVFVDRLVKPHKFEAVAIFVGNDIVGKPDDKSLEEVLQLVEFIVGKIHAHNATAPVFLIAITPTRSRWEAWDKIKQLNARLAKYCQQHEQLHFIDTAEQYLDSAGLPLDKYFVEDKLHQNQAGYELWSRIIKQSFAKVLPAR